MAPKVGAPSIHRSPEAATITPIELACLVQQYLMENQFPKTLQEFQTEAGHLLSTVRTPKSMRSLNVILSEYINLKAFEAHAAAEKARADQLLRNLCGVLDEFRPGSIKDYVASQSPESDKKGLLQQSLGKENARQQRGKKSRKSGASNGGPPILSAPALQPSSQPPPFLQNGHMWPQSSQNAYVFSPQMNQETAPSLSPSLPGTSLSPPGLSHLVPNVNMPQANGSGHSPGGMLNPQQHLPAAASAPVQPAPSFAPLRNSSGTSQPSFRQPVHPGQTQRPVVMFQTPPAAGTQGVSPAPHPVHKPLQMEGGQGQSQIAEEFTASEASSSQQQEPRMGTGGMGQSVPSLPVPQEGQSNPLMEELAGGSEPSAGASQQWPSLDSPRRGSLDGSQQRDSATEGGKFPHFEAVDLSTPPKAAKSSSARAAARALASPLKSPHAGRKGTPRKRKMDDGGKTTPAKKVSPSRALFGGQPEPAPVKQPKKALFMEDPAKANQGVEEDGQKGVKDGRVSDAGLLDHLELPGDGPMGEADFRALVVDTFSKDMDLPSRIAGHITQVMHGGGQGAADGDPLQGLDIPGDASDWGTTDGAGLGDDFFTDDDIPVDDILAAITADPHVSQLLDSLAATPVSLSGFEDFGTNDAT